MPTVTQPPSRRSRLAAIIGSHLTMLTLFGWMLQRYQPEPNSLRFNRLSTVALWAAITAAAPLILLGSTSLLGLLTGASVHGLSPLLLRSTAADPRGDLNFAALLWWGPVPAVVLIVVLVDSWVTGRRGASAPMAT
jgi:hypothetical protein